MTARRKRTVAVAGAARLAEGASLKFSYKERGFPAEGFLIRKNGRLLAYRNRCPHAGSPLDFGDNEFFTDDGRFLLCRAHGALFEPEGGACAAGPCHGRGLEALPVAQRRDGKAVIGPF